jgi:dipeptidyl aminopeptidase/acylaminoacyl peptidase
MILPRKLISIFSLSLCLYQGCAASASHRIAHPDDSSKQIEYFVAVPSGKGPFPTVILLHGHQEIMRPGGEDFAKWGVLRQLASRGYLAVAVSQPGYGNSSGPADFCGIFTQHAVSSVIAKLRAEGLASPQKLLIEGISRGALTAALVAAQDASISGLVLISGVYDLQGYGNDPDASPGKQSVWKALSAETGGAPSALKARSVLPHAEQIRAATLLLNGAKDDRTNPDQARSLAHRITQAGGEAQVIIYPDFGHQIPVEKRNKDIDPFIDRVLGIAGH